MRDQQLARCASPTGVRGPWVAILACVECGDGWDFCKKMAKKERGSRRQLEQLRWPMLSDAGLRLRILRDAAA